MIQYNPNHPIDPEWILLDEEDRIKLVYNYHDQHREALDSQHESSVQHATLHAIVESQLAEGHEVPVKTLERLLAEGLTRHEAIHGLVYAVANFIYEAGAGKATSQPGEDPNTLIWDQMLKLNIDEWKSFGSEPGSPASSQPSRSRIKKADRKKQKKKRKAGRRK